MTDDLYIIAELRAKKEHTMALGDLLESLVEPTRKEAGCVRYDLWQDKHDSGQFILVEQWKSEEELEAHLKAPHLMHAKKQFETLLASPLVLRFFDHVG